MVNPGDFIILATAVLRQQRRPPQSLTIQTTSRLRHMIPTAQHIMREDVRRDCLRSVSRSDFFYRQKYR